MASLHLLTCLAIIVLYLCQICDCSGITSNRYKKYTDVAPTGTAFNSVSSRSRLDCSKSCSNDPKCSTFTIKEIGSVVECETYTCWESVQNTTLLGVNTFTKKVTDLVVCPAGYSRVCNHCYLYHAAKVTWGAAQTYCTSTDPHSYLAEVTSLEENDYILGVVGYDTWLGGVLFSGTWIWTHSDQNVGYKNWFPGRPDGNGDCIVIGIINMGSDIGRWFEWRCSDLRHVICEYGN